MSDLKRAAYVLAMAVVQSDAWATADDELRRAVALGLDSPLAEQAIASRPSQGRDREEG